MTSTSVLSCQRDQTRPGIDLDDKGFVLTGANDTLATGRGRVFVVGDVRAVSTKRVVAAMGDGAVVVAKIHRVLAEDASPAAAS